MKSELGKVVNETAHAMAARSFNNIRLQLRELARNLARQGKKPDEVARVIQEVGLRGDLPRQ